MNTCYNKNDIFPFFENDCRWSTVQLDCLSNISTITNSFHWNIFNDTTSNIPLSEFNSKCCQSDSPFINQYEYNTQNFNFDDQGNCNALNNINIDCNKDALIYTELSSIDSDNWRYKYGCGQIIDDKDKINCYKKSTDYKDIYNRNDNNLEFSLNCNDNEYISSLDLEQSVDDQKFRYNYTCCKISNCKYNSIDDCSKQCEPFYKYDSDIKTCVQCVLNEDQKTGNCDNEKIIYKTYTECKELHPLYRCDKYGDCYSCSDMDDKSKCIYENDMCNSNCKPLFIWNEQDEICEECDVQKSNCHDETITKYDTIEKCKEDHPPYKCNIYGNCEKCNVSLTFKDDEILKSSNSMNNNNKYVILYICLLVLIIIIIIFLIKIYYR